MILLLCKKIVLRPLKIFITYKSQVLLSYLRFIFMPFPYKNGKYFSIIIFATKHNNIEIIATTIPIIKLFCANAFLVYGIAI